MIEELLFFGCTILDMQTAVEILAQYCSMLNLLLINFVKQIFENLKDIVNFGIKIPSQKFFK